MFRAVQTERFYLYTPKWNVNRLIDAIIEFNEVELTEIKKPGLKPAKRRRGPEKEYMETLEKLKLILEEIKKTIGEVKYEDVKRLPSISLGEIEKLCKEADEKIRLLKHFPDDKMIENIRKELEEVNIELTRLENEIFSSLEPRVRAKVKESQTEIFRTLNSLEECTKSLEEVLREIADAPDKVRDPKSLSDKINTLITKTNDELLSLPKDLGKKLLDQFQRLKIESERLIPLLVQLSGLKTSEKQISQNIINEIKSVSNSLLQILNKFRESLADAGNSILSTSVLISEGISLDEILSEYAKMAEPLIERKQELEKRLSVMEDLVKRKEEEQKRLREELLDLGLKIYAAMQEIRRRLLKLKISEYIYEGENVSVISGWIPPSLKDRFQEHMKAKLGSLMELRFEEDKKAPVYIRLPSFMAPFRLLTHRMMGYPKAEQLDPTPLVSLLFPIMFGMMFGDLGHGLVLLLFGLFIRRGRGQTLRDLGGVLIPAGICSMFFGFLYGEVFLKEAYEPILFSPIHEPLKMLMIAILFGLVHLNIAFIASVINKIAERRYLASIAGYGGLSTIGMYDLAAYAVYRTKGDVIASFSDPYMRIAAGLLGITALSILIESKIGGHELSEGMMELFEAVLEGTIGLLANSLSYLRLAGFAIAHASFGIIAESIVGESGGVILFLVASALMNLFAMGLEGMAAFIQASRLTLYEFMTKFFHGGGRPLRTVDGLIG
ncbi:MAG: hypothetical protein DRO05_07410 [Thermoproteota archaeon]|nr:MAG: hypothetical protein DRO05_07410 [Candidatus Korarchaeota archaeon]